MSDLGIRVEGSEVQTLIREFEHRDTGSRIGVVALMHIGNPSYYEHIKAYIAETEEERGAHVLYEQVRPLSETESQHFPDFSQDEQDQLLGLSRMLVTRLEGVVAQGDAMTYGPTWTNADISLAELLNLIGTDRARRIIQKSRLSEEHTYGIDPDRVKGLVLLSYRVMTGKLAPILGVISTVSALLTNRHDTAVLVKHRNQVALDAIDADLADDPSQSITLLYGPDHLRGISKGLRQRNYNVWDEYWVDALYLG